MFFFFWLDIPPPSRSTSPELILSINQSINQLINFFFFFFFSLFFITLLSQSNSPFLITNPITHPHIYLFTMASKFARFMNSETGPKTIHFWVCIYICNFLVVFGLLIGNRVSLGAHARVHAYI